MFVGSLVEERIEELPRGLIVVRGLHIQSVDRCLYVLCAASAAAAVRLICGPVV
ncbi:unnamed protein product [Ectocarpus sp. CCAP 1310/34]|nr:unnamed protein product [Ectocarpus sp. CCAP 1310/34]